MQWCLHTCSMPVWLCCFSQDELPLTLESGLARDWPWPIECGGNTWLPVPGPQKFSQFQSPPFWDVRMLFWGTIRGSRSNYWKTGHVLLTWGAVLNSQCGCSSNEHSSCHNQPIEFGVVLTPSIENCNNCCCILGNCLDLEKLDFVQGPVSYYLLPSLSSRKFYFLTCRNKMTLNWTQWRYTRLRPESVWKIPTSY